MHEQRGALVLLWGVLSYIWCMLEGNNEDSLDWWAFVLPERQIQYKKDTIMSQFFLKRGCWDFKLECLTHVT